MFPILALAEGTSLQAGVLLATRGAKIPKQPFGIRAQKTMGGLDNTQEVHLMAKEPLPDKPVQRTLPSVLGGNMMTYSWTINGAPYPNRNSLNVKQGERVELVISNTTGMSHPMHLHGHVFEVTEVDGRENRRRETGTLFWCRRNRQSKLSSMPTTRVCGPIIVTSSTISRLACSRL